MTPEERAARANTAKRLMDDPMIVEAFGAVEEALTTAWRNTLPGDAERLTQLHSQLWALDKFRECFRQALIDGRLAEHDLDRIKNG